MRRSPFTIALLMGLMALLPERAAVADTRQALEEEARRHGAPMAWIRDGAFQMGIGPQKGTANVAPAHLVYLYAFYMDLYEVSTARYADFLKAKGPSSGLAPMFWHDVQLRDDGAKPVLGVTWDAAKAYCTWAGKRLPTEAEWEKAARGTDGRSYPWGNAVPTFLLANFERPLSGQRFTDSLRAVDSDEAGQSPYGIFGMAGNVSEWVSDWYDDAYYGHSPASNPQGPASGTRKVIRGGSFGDLAAGVNSASRDSSAPTDLAAFAGIRCARDAF